MWKEASAGERRVALLAGEAGIGKTRLAGELASTTLAAGATVLAGRCDEDLGVPYQPFVEALRQYMSRRGDQRLGRPPGELTRLVPELAELVPGLPEPLRSEEAEGPLVEAATTSPARELFDSLLARLYAEQGRLEEAGHHFASLAREDFSTVPTNQLWLTTMCNAAVVATCLGDEARAGALRGALTPYAGQVAGLPILYVGPVTHFLGLLAATVGQVHEAEAHFADAVESGERIGAPLFVARSRLYWARTLLRSGPAGDAERGHRLLTQVVDSATGLGFVAVERQAQELLAAS